MIINDCKCWLYLYTLLSALALCPSIVHCPGPCCFDPFSLWQKFPLSGMVDFRAVAVLAALAICGELQIPFSTSISKGTIRHKLG